MFVDRGWSMLVGFRFSWMLDTRGFSMAVDFRCSWVVDGRGFSSARLLRERYNYSGEIRAVGGFIRDQIYLLNRCGFNAFKFDDASDLNESVKSLEDFSETYQVSSDQKDPLFRRR